MNSKCCGCFLMLAGVFLQMVDTLNLCAFHSLHQNRYVLEHDCVFSIILHNDLFVACYLICVNLLHLYVREDVLYCKVVDNVSHDSNAHIMWLRCRWWIIFSY